MAKWFKVREPDDWIAVGIGAVFVGFGVFIACAGLVMVISS